MSNYPDDEYATWMHNYMPAEDFFGEDPQADFYYWAKLSYWTIDEATTLSFGFEPRIANSARVIDPGHPFVIEYDRRLEQLRRAVIAGELPERIPPLAYKTWTERVGVSLSPELAQILGSAKQPPAGTNERQFNPKERQSWQKLCLGLVCAKYGYKAGATRNPAHGKITKDLAGVGIDLDEDTVRKCLTSASDEFGHLVQHA